MAYGIKGKKQRDWWIKLQNEPSHPIDLVQLAFLFEYIPELKDYS
jgi:hypothetical protein